ncbi:hypothetical protein PROFUN_14900 [Planoprotostelium fungivorum]|uniref:Trafficking protein particle complex II-specific subunit 65 IgD3 domain-containing protein n=1 Tax=Planoprotostelium fungivorum TaxID=1890364 RepID=A0A2P6MY82_9EUKA|nr:hypothetical protein PROFUN_14900 [Planoprotostelium fungivorum]
MVGGVTKDRGIPSHLFNPTTSIPSDSFFQLHLPVSNQEQLQYEGEPLLGGSKRLLTKAFLQSLKGRDFVVQGELLRAYLFIASPPLRSYYKTSGETEDKSEDNARPLQMGEHLKLVEFYKCFGTACSFNVDLDTGVSKITQSSRADPDGNMYKHSFLRPAVKLNPEAKPGQPEGKKLGGEQLSGMDRVENNTVSEREMLNHPNFFRFEDGDALFVYELEYPIAVKDDAVNESVQLKVTVKLPSFPVRRQTAEVEEFTRLLNPFYSERSTQDKEIVAPVRIVQPFSIEFNTLNIGNSFLINALVKNNDARVTLVLDDVDLFLFDKSQDATHRKLYSSSNLDGQFKITVPEDDLPTELKSQDQQSMVFIVEPIVTCRDSKENVSYGLAIGSSRPCSRISFTWHTNEIYGKVISSYDVEVHPLVHPASNDLMITVQADSPAPLYRPFSICVTVSNLGDKKRDLTLLMAQTPRIIENQPDSEEEIDTEKTMERPESTEIETHDVTGHPKPLTISQQKTDRQPPILCLDKSVTLGVLKPKMTVSAYLSYIAVREGLFDLDHIAVHDWTTDKTFAVKNKCQIYVQD